MSPSKVGRTQDTSISTLKELPLQSMRLHQRCAYKIMAPHQRKKAFNRGTFLLVDGAKYDVSNIVHESTELIPDEIQVMIRRCKWDDNLYPTVLEIENGSIQDTGESLKSGGT